MLNTQNVMLENKFSLPVRVYYQDTDAGGVVYHSIHLNFMERARYEWLRSLGFDVESLTQVQKTLFMVRSLEIEYFKPAVLDDLLDITVQVTDTGRSRMEISHETFCSDVRLVCAKVNVVCVGTDTLKPISIPMPLREKIGRLI